VTPFLDSLAKEKESVIFSNAIVAGVPTYFSFPAIMASRHPFGLGRDVLGIAPNEPTLATALRDSGYRTAAFLAGNPYLSPRFGYHQGFEEFHDFLDAPASGQPTPPGTSVKGESVKQESLKQRSVWNHRIETLSRHTRLTSSAYDELYFWYGQWRSAGENLSADQLRAYPAADVIVDRALAWLSGLGDKNFFLWVHLMDPHHPYYPPDAAQSSLGISPITARRARFLNSIWNRGDIGPERLQRYRPDVLALYSAGVHWVDKQVARLVSALHQSQRWDETEFVLTADHGEEFIEHGDRYHSPASLSEQLIHVPLLIHAPGLPATSISTPFSLIHLAPTLLEGVEAQIPESFRGRSCWRQISLGNLPDEPAIAESIECTNPLQIDDRRRPRLMTVRNGEYKLVIRFSREEELLYDLKKDPGEDSPLPSGALVRERAQLLQAARIHLRQSREKYDTGLALSARFRELRQSVRPNGKS
jgi:arylsulfatase A-like enzyme